MQTQTYSPVDFDVTAIRRQFPILTQSVYGKPLVYFDNAATTQKPLRVIEAIDDYYRRYNANVHRGVHYLSQVATDAMEASRETIRQFINARSIQEVIFTGGTTDGINLVADTITRLFNPADEVIVSAMEHHSNIVPWQFACQRYGLKLRVVPMTMNGELVMEEYEKLLNEKTRLVSIVHVSNALGTINPVEQIISLAHERGIPVMLDGAQAVQHLKVDVQRLDCDFYAFSGHKMYGPTGIGVLYGKQEWLEKLPPYRGGGEMIKSVTFEETTFNDLPFKFEAGTPHVEGIVALGEAARFLNEVGLDRVRKYEFYVLDYATNAVNELPNVELRGMAEQKSSVLSFNFKGLHPYDVGVILDKLGIAVRTGNHCAQPIMDYFCVPGTIRASFAMYNTTEEVDLMVTALKRALKMLV
ncbi:MAG TPA: cysteine desulfurase [Chitinophagales bacterium]|nr:cysteine desulfurase [Chitinophagales bacterium]